MADRADGRHCNAGRQPKQKQFNEFAEQQPSCVSAPWGSSKPRPRSPDSVTLASAQCCGTGEIKRWRCCDSNVGTTFACGRLAAQASWRQWQRSALGITIAWRIDVAESPSCRGQKGTQPQSGHCSSCSFCGDCCCSDTAGNTYISCVYFAIVRL